MFEIEEFDAATRALDEAVARYTVALQAVSAVMAADAKNHLDSKSELGETESLRLQMAMDRTSQFMSVLSNVLTKMSDTGSAIFQNLK